MKTTLVVLAISALGAMLWAVPQTATPISAPRNLTPDQDAVTIPRMLSYQGKLTDSLGNPVADTTYSVVFRLYTVPSGGSSFWNETQTVRTRTGLFSALLGSVTPIGSMPDAGSVYLGMAVAGGAELTPRLRIASAAYAYLTERAANADLLQGRDTTTFSRSGHNHDAAYVNEGQAGSVTSTMITDATIAAADIGQMGASSNQVLKWTGSAWAPRNDSVGGGGGGGTVTSVSQSTGVVCTPNPITTTGTVAFDATYGDGRYVNTTGDSMTGALAVQSDLRVYGKGRIGLGNSNAGTAAFVAGEGNVASANYSSVSGGADNTASGVYSHISGGGENRAAGDYSSVSGGVTNYASGGRSTVAGGSDNEAYGLYAAIGGGRTNIAGDAAVDTCATVAGGHGNRAAGKFAAVGGGQGDTASGDWATVGGGRRNVADTSYATVGGGYNNSATSGHSFVGGGASNWATGQCAATAGGEGNSASGSYAEVGGGHSNSASGGYAAVGGGDGNLASAYCTTVDGGFSNETTDSAAAVGGGRSNHAHGRCATIAGGRSNIADSSCSSVGGGSANEAIDNYATVGGGSSNVARGNNSTVPGGFDCVAAGSGSFACGTGAKSIEAGCFTWADANTADVVNSTENRWAARASGGVYFYTSPLMTAGSYLAAGGSSWNSVSDSMTKENFRPVDKSALLEALLRIRVRDYNLKSQDPSVRHIGPVAQDFHRAFGFGESNTAINMEDADGVLLAVVQALCEQSQQLFNQNQALNKRVTELEARQSDR